MMLNTEQKIHQLINRYRNSIHLPSLALDENISQLAREHSAAMADHQVPFGNYGFKERIRKIALFLIHKEAAENVASYQGQPVNEEIVLQFWLKSARHRRIIQGDYQLTGIGVAKNADEVYYFTQIFIRD
jgi:uncharacterized protein YkwD